MILIAFTGISTYFCKICTMCFIFGISILYFAKDSVQIDCKNILILLSIYLLYKCHSFFLLGQLFFMLYDFLPKGFDILAWMRKSSWRETGFSSVRFNSVNLIWLVKTKRINNLILCACRQLLVLVYGLLQNCLISGTVTKLFRQVLEETTLSL